RSFRREGERLVVPLGSVASAEQKTVLVRLRMPRAEKGERELVSARLSFEEVGGRSGASEGKLLVQVVDNPKSDTLDPLVEERVRRSTTVGTLTDANRLFERGDGATARRKLESTLDELKQSRAQAVAAAPAPKKDSVDREFARQEAALGAAASAFAEPPSAAGEPAEKSKAGRAAVRSNQANASELAF
ncbi:MAG TPA: hypothetical protein VGP93_06160, partial [Polyangiaceae bacterium]|nr:hypothetical protein [Polyangiaceae bacterium]